MKTTIKSNKLDIFTEAFGEQDNPAVLLIMGATAQGSMWKEEFCKDLAKHGFFVIRYDHRDTGKSSRVNYLTHQYYLKELAEDTLNILDAYGIQQANLVGLSMGSFIAQYNAIHFPQRVKSLVCLMSSPQHAVFVEGFSRNDTSHHLLPPSHPKLLDFYEEILSISTHDVDEDYLLHKEAWKKVGGDEYLLDVRIFEGKILKRLKNHKYIHNHSYALANSPSLHEELHTISCPTLIIHGSDDYILPIEHGKKLAILIANSTFLEYKYMGHCLSNDVYDKLVMNLSNFLKNEGKNENSATL